MQHAAVGIAIIPKDQGGPAFCGNDPTHALAKPEALPVPKLLHPQNIAALWIYGLYRLGIGKKLKPF